tara:strand:- start:253 stop:669 length:417 start_codon:yes stop_codon:yes gene_type:complete
MPSEEPRQPPPLVSCRLAALAAFLGAGRMSCRLLMLSRPTSGCSAARGQVLLVATRLVPRALHKKAQQANLTDEDREAPLPGASLRWFGPRMRDLNRFSNGSTVVAGRRPPPVEEIEASGRGVFADAREPPPSRSIPV